MKKKELISVIVPVYNVEKYIKRCIDSIINQSYSNIEIILVNDGSTDKSGPICDEYSKLHSNITAIHKENGGVSSARNVGIQYAKGMYIGFVDSDDYIYPEMYEKLMQSVEKWNVEIATCGVSNSKNETPEYKGNHCISKLELIKNKFPGGGYAVNCIYKRDVIERYNIKFNMNYSYGEDMLFVLGYLSHIEDDKIGKIEEKLYLYEISETSVNNVGKDIKKRDKNISTWISAVEEGYAIILEDCKIPEKDIVTEYIDFFFGLFLYNKNIICKKNMIDKISIKKEYFNRKHKVYYKILKINPNILYLWGNVLKKIKNR